MLCLPYMPSRTTEMVDKTYYKVQLNLWSCGRPSRAARARTRLQRQMAHSHLLWGAARCLVERPIRWVRILGGVEYLAVIDVLDVAIWKEAQLKYAAAAVRDEATAGAWAG